MLKIIQRRRISKGARLINKVNQLYKVGDVDKADKLKKKLPYNKPEVMYWMTSESIFLRAREG